MSKLRGVRLENEVDKGRAECRWGRISELLPSIKVKGSGLEHLFGFLYGEWKLEKYVEELGAFPSPDPSHKEPLKVATEYLRSVFEEKGESSGAGGGRWPQAALEAHLLLAKVAYVTADFEGALASISKARLEGKDIQFQTLRTLRLVAEAYAIKGLAMEAQSQSSSTSRYQRALKEEGILAAFEKASDLALSYISELEKAVTGGPEGAPTGAGWSGVEQRIGLVLETALQRVPLMYIEQGCGGEAAAQAGFKQACLSRGVEQYRKVLTVTDKPVAQALHQKLCRQLAEVLVRGVSDGLYAPPLSSQAAALKAKQMRFYLGGPVFCPESRLEELLVVLAVSESIAAREAVLSRAEEDSAERAASHEDVKAVQNLLTLVLAGVAQFGLLSGILERALKFAFEDAFVWIQFALSLSAAGRDARAAAVFNQTLASLEDDDADKDPVPHLFAANLALEQLAQPKEALKHAQRALELAGDSALAGRAQLLIGLATSGVAMATLDFASRKDAYKVAISELEKAVEADPDDHLAEFFLGLQLGMVRDTAGAKEHCLRSLELCPDQPGAYLLLALLLTASGDLDEAGSVVDEALEEFPSHYGLLVLRLKLEVRSGKVESALGTGRQLLLFWKLRGGGEWEAMSGPGQGRLGVARRAVSPMGGVGEDTTTDSGINASTLLLPSMAGTLPRSGSVLEMAERESVLGGAPSALSELGGVASTVSESMGVTNSSERRWALAQWRTQANIWLELAEMFLAAGRVGDVAACVEEATAAFPNSHQTLYLRGRIRALEAGRETEGSERRRALLEEAKSCFLGALALFPAHLPSLRHLAGAYGAGGNWEMAEGILGEVVGLEPAWDAVWAELGGVLAQAEQRQDDAAQAYATALLLADSTPLLPYSVIPRILHL